jgi:cell division protein FtsQ
MKPAAPLPMDIRLMHLATGSLLAVLVLMGLAAGGRWLVNRPAFGLQAIEVQGEVTRNNAMTLKSNVVPHLLGNFFTVSLRDAQEAFEAVPWVRKAVVHRVFPDRLRVDLLEHKPIAFWGDEGGSGMVNEQGDVFEANVAEVEADGLPRLRGPADRSQEVLAMYRSLRPVLKNFDMDIDVLELSPRGSWLVQTGRGALIELGRGPKDALEAQLRSFLRTLPQVASAYGRTPRALLAADLRHKDGYALRLEGVSTLDAQALKKP